MSRYSRSAIYSVAFTIFSVICSAQKRVFKIILNTETLPGDIDSTVVNHLNESLRAMVAFYGALGGSNCNENKCELTTALGLGDQGSIAHKALIKKYFKNDKVAKQVLLQDCYLRPSGASTFSEYAYLNLITIKDTVKVNYRIGYYDHGKTGYTIGHDIYLLIGNEFVMLKRDI
jgi:hypothetical protein